MSQTSFPVIIVGAGPAGLSLAYMLQRLGIDYLVLEKSRVGESWLNMADELQVLSPLWTNVLPGTRPKLWELYRKPTALEYADYLASYRGEYGLSVEEDIEVLGMEVAEREPERFRLSTSKGLYQARILVCASGYYSNPYVPKPPGRNDGTIKEMHASDYRNPAQIGKIVEAGARVLIVGKRVTAGQLMVELGDAGFTVALSTRGEVVTRNASLLGRLKEAIYFPYEEIRARFVPDLRGNSYADMEGGRTEVMLRSGQVDVVPDIHAIDDGQIHFVDGSKGHFDLIVYATGYRPSLAYVEQIAPLSKTDGIPCTQDMQSSDVRGLYFIGIDNLRNFRSRYLRGIRDDAKRLASIIKEELCLAPQEPEGVERGVSS